MTGSIHILSSRPHTTNKLVIALQIPLSLHQTKPYPKPGKATQPETIHRHNLLSSQNTTWRVGSTSILHHRLDNVDALRPWLQGESRLSRNCRLGTCANHHMIDWIALSRGYPFYSFISLWLLWSLWSLDHIDHIDHFDQSFTLLSLSLSSLSSQHTTNTPTGSWRQAAPN